MSASSTSAKPLPQIITFLTSQAILGHSHTHTTLVLNPINHWPIHDFPYPLAVSLMVELTGGRDVYHPELVLYDSEDNPVWSDRYPPFEAESPLLPHRQVFQDIPLVIPAPGRYRLAYLLNGVEVMQRSLWFGPKELFLRPMK